MEYVFGSLDLDWNQYVEVDEKFLRPEELHHLKGDPTKIQSIIEWDKEYTFETMLDEMIEYWQNYYSGKSL